MKEFELVVLENTSVSIFSEMCKNSTFCNFRSVKTLMQETQVDNSPTENFSTARKVWKLTRMEETKPVVLVKMSLNIEKKITLKGFHWNFRCIWILMPGRKTMIF